MTASDAADGAGCTWKRGAGRTSIGGGAPRLNFTSRQSPRPGRGWSARRRPVTARAATTTQPSPTTPAVTRSTPGSWADIQMAFGPSSELMACPATLSAARAVAWLSSVDRIVRTLASATRQRDANPSQSSSSSPAGQLRRPGSLRRSGGMLSTRRSPAREAITSRRFTTSTPLEPPRCGRRLAVSAADPARNGLVRAARLLLVLWPIGGHDLSDGRGAVVRPPLPLGCVGGSQILAKPHKIA
jgi:hypothetical protein